MEQLLPGGFVNAVIRVGDTVRRPPSPNAGFVHDLLDHLERHGWTGAPRYLGTDADGREILSFLEGHVAWEDRQPAWSTPSSGGRTGAGGVSRPGRRPATRPCGGCVTGALSEPCGPTMPG